MFDKIDEFYQLHNVYKTIIITNNDETEFFSIKNYLDENSYSSIILNHIEDYNSDDNINNIIIINNFKNDQNRILIMTYTTWYCNKKLISKLILSNSLFIVGSILDDNKSYIYNWINNYNNKTYFLNLFDDIY